MKNDEYRDIPKTICIITYCRPTELARLVNEIDYNFCYFGHDPSEWSITVVDNSPYNYAKKNKEILYAAKSMLPIFYFGIKESEKLGNEFDALLNYGGVFGEIIRTDCGGGRIRAILLGVDKTLVLLDDDMKLTELMISDESDADAKKCAEEALKCSGREGSIVSTGRFYKISETGIHTYERPFDLIESTTSMLGKKVKETKVHPDYMGRAFGNRDKLIDELMVSSFDDDGYKSRIGLFSAEKGDIDPEAIIYWQGVNSVTGKTDCHATASIQGIGSLNSKSLTQDEYGNLFVNYAVHDSKKPKKAIVSEWKESSMATFGILNTHPVPAYLLTRSEDILFRHIFRSSSPVALVPVGVYHDRSLTGRPDLAVIYLKELMDAKICKTWKESIRYYDIGNGNGIYELGFIEEPELDKDEKKSILRSIKKTYAILEETARNEHRLAKYSKVLMDSLNRELGGSFSSHEERESESFRTSIFRTIEDYLHENNRRQKKLFQFWPDMVDYVRQNELPIKSLNPSSKQQPTISKK